jgi:hypothetical protein
MRSPHGAACWSSCRVLLGGNTKKGVEYLERAVSLDDTAVGKRLELAEAYHLVGRDQDATRTANDALAMAEGMQDPGKTETCKRFITELPRVVRRLRDRVDRAMIGVG